MTAMIVGIMAMTFSNAFPAVATGDAPLPQNVRIVIPADTIPLDVAAFAGRFEGWWFNRNHSILLVREIRLTEKGEYRTDVIYAWGASVSGNLKPGFKEATGEIKKGALVLKSPDKPVEIIFRLNKGGDLEAYYRNTQTGESANALFKKQDTAAAR